MELENLKELLVNKKLADVKKIYEEMNEYDIASLIEELPEELIIQAFRLLPKDKAVDVFVNMDDEVQRDLIAELTKKEAKAIIEEMFTDDAVDLFEEMPAMLVTSLLGSVDKETRNDINRLVNCETANLNKTINAAVKQIEDIKLIKKKHKFSSLPENLQEIAELRIANPDVSLVELGKMLSEPIGKSGVNHRLKKLSSIAEELRFRK